jgi:uncharacterized membrane protein YtjA (UPF0391 family)
MSALSAGLVRAGIGRCRGAVSADSYDAARGAVLQRKGVCSADGCPRERLQWTLRKPGALMLHYAVVFLVIALIAALFGFGGIAAGAASIAQILFIVFIVLAVVSFVVSLLRRG